MAVSDDFIYLQEIFSAEDFNRRLTVLPLFDFIFGHTEGNGFNFVHF
jgi:hypothetical protein